MPDDNNAKGKPPAVLPPDVVKVIETLPAERRAAVEKAFVRTIAKFHSGPLPDAETLERYAEVIPNVGERMMALVEREAAHRHECESKLVTCQTTLAKRGQWIGSLLTVLLTGVGTYLALQGHDWLAGVVFTTTIGAVVTIFVLQRIAGDKDEDGTPPANGRTDNKNKRKPS